MKKNSIYFLFQRITKTYHQSYFIKGKEASDGKSEKITLLDSTIVKSIKNHDLR